MDPFHSVNSPVLAPVTTRFPSGNQRATLMGQRALFMDMWTNFVQAPSMGSFKDICEGSIYKETEGAEPFFSWLH